MSLGAIQDNLVKVPLVQQTTTKSDDVARGQENFQVAEHRENSRQADEVVLQTQQRELNEDREKEEQRRRKQEQEEQEQAQRQRSGDDEEEEDTRPRAKMHRLNILA